MILVVDYGSQYTQLIARRVRELNVFSVIVAFDDDLKSVDLKKIKGVILSGGPQSVYADEGYPLNKQVMQLGVPVLGVCYGAQLIAEHFGGKVEHSPKREFGRAALKVLDHSDFFGGVEASTQVWMSHGDKITNIDQTFDVIGNSDHSPYAAVRHRQHPIFAVQFHPEVYHTQQGQTMLHNFVINCCGCEQDWTPGSFIELTLEQLRAKIGKKRVVCAVSGGVDSTVMATLLHKAVGDQCICIFVDNGLLRLNEAETVYSMLTNELGLKVELQSAASDFLQALKGIADPEIKRKRIGHTFIEVFDRVASGVDDVAFLAQGTLYPDVIESVSHRGPSQTIKTHHNVGGLPDKMQLDLIEPFRELFKDEVRQVGLELGIPRDILWRHPFPGPGLAVRVLGEITEPRLNVLRQADAIFVDELKRSGEYDNVWQALAVLLPVQSVGVMGDQRTYENVCALRAVSSTDGMTADWSRLPGELLATISTRIINEVSGINRVVYDISSKPPSTIEWE